MHPLRPIRNLLIDLANPFHPRGFHIGGHVLLAALIALGYVAGFGSGWQAHKIIHDRQYFAQHYKAPLPVLPPRSKPLPLLSRGTLPAAAHISIKYLNDQINDQGPIGSCAQWGFNKALSYAFNKISRWNGSKWFHYHRFYSPRWTYDQISQGNDAGSNDEQGQSVVQSMGIPQWKQMPYGSAASTVGLPAYQVDWPVPGQFATAAAQHHFPGLYVQPLWTGQGAGLGGLQLIQQHITQGDAVTIDIPVYDTFDGATQTGGFIGMPDANSYMRGGHEVFVLGYFQANGHTWVAISNQWNNYWGVNQAATQPYWGKTTGSQFSIGFLEDQYVEQYAYQAQTVSVGSSDPGADGGKKPVAPPFTAPTPPKAGTSSWYVRPFYTRDTGQNISPILNAAGDYYHLAPTFLLGVTLAESGGYARAERWSTWPDQSCGLMQQIILNVWSKIGQTSARAACDWEEVPQNSVWFGASILRDYLNRTGVPPPALWACYNAGPGSCRSPYYAGFLANYYVALTYGTSDPGPPPTPTPHKARFGKLPARVWSQYRHEHHLSFIPHTGFFPWHWRRHHFRKAGGIVQHERYNRKTGTMFEVLQGGYAWFWPHHIHWRVVWKGHRWMR